MDYQSKGPLYPFRLARRWFPRRRRDKRPSVQTLYKWSKPPGFRGTILWSAQVGSTRCTTREACEEFIARVTALTLGPQSQVNAPAPKADQQVDDALLKAGFDRPPAARGVKRSRPVGGPHDVTSPCPPRPRVDETSDADQLGGPG